MHRASVFRPKAVKRPISAIPLFRPPTSGRLFEVTIMSEKAVAVAWWGAWSLLLVALIAFNLS